MVCSRCCGVLVVVVVLGDACGWTKKGQYACVVSQKLPRPRLLGSDQRGHFER